MTLIEGAADVSVGLALDGLRKPKGFEAGLSSLGGAAGGAPVAEDDAGSVGAVGGCIAPDPVVGLKEKEGEGAVDGACCVDVGEGRDEASPKPGVVLCCVPGVGEEVG